MIFVLLAALIVFWPARRGTPVFDDQAILDMEPKFKRGAYARLSAWRHPRALTHLTYQWTYHLFGYAPFAWHTFNWILHAAAILLIYRLSHQFGFTESRAILAAAVFALHPLQGASVCYVSARAGMLAELFALAGITLWMDSYYQHALLAGILTWKSKEEGPLYLIFWPVASFFAGTT